MKRCIKCNYRARTTKRLVKDKNGNYYVCRDQKLCDKTATHKGRVIVNA